MQGIIEDETISQYNVTQNTNYTVGNKSMQISAKR